MAEPEFDFTKAEQQFGRPFPHDRRLMGLYALVGRPEEARLGYYWTAGGEFTGVDPVILMDRLRQQGFGCMLPEPGDAVANIRLPNLLQDGEMDSLMIDGPPLNISWRSAGLEPNPGEPHSWMHFVCFVLEYEQLRLGEFEEGEPVIDVDVVRGEVEIGVRIGIDAGRVTPKPLFYRTDAILRNGETLADSGTALFPDIDDKEVDAFIRLMQEFRRRAERANTGSEPNDDTIESKTEQSE